MKGNRYGEAYTVLELLRETPLQAASTFGYEMQLLISTIVNEMGYKGTYITFTVRSKLRQFSLAVTKMFRYSSTAGTATQTSFSKRNLIEQPSLEGWLNFSPSRGIGGRVLLPAWLWHLSKHVFLRPHLNLAMHKLTRHRQLSGVNIFAFLADTLLSNAQFYKTTTIVSFNTMNTQSSNATSTLLSSTTSTQPPNIKSLWISFGFSIANAMFVFLLPSC